MESNVKITLFVRTMEQEWWESESVRE